MAREFQQFILPGLYYDDTIRGQRGSITLYRVDDKNNAYKIASKTAKGNITKQSKHYKVGLNGILNNGAYHIARLVPATRRDAIIDGFGKFVEQFPPDASELPMPPEEWFSS